MASPSSTITDGSNTARMIVASSSTAAARPTPSSLSETSGRVANRANTATITTAALVITPAVRPIPAVTAARVDSPRSWPSLIRLTTNTW